MVAIGKTATTRRPVGSAPIDGLDWLRVGIAVAAVGWGADQFAAGRSCGEWRGACQLFKAVWSRAHWLQRIDAHESDHRPHAHLVDRSRHCTHTATLDSLPDGCLTEHDGAFWLVRGVHLYAWTLRGYENPGPRPAFPARVTVRAPRATVATLRAGDSPHEHPSAVSTEMEVEQ